MNWLNNIVMQKKLALLLLFPMVALLFFAGDGASSRWTSWKLMSGLENIVQLSAGVNDLVEEMQKERGRTAVFVSSAGKSFTDELAEQRRAVDDHLARIRPELQAAMQEYRGDAIEQQIRNTLEQLDQLAARRAEANKLQTTPAAIADYFTETLHALLLINDHLTTLSENDEITRMLQAYSKIADVQEHVGQERYLLSEVFTTKQMPVDSLNALSMVAHDQEYFIEQFLIYATPDIQAFYSEQMKHDCVARAESMRASAMIQKNFGTTPDEVFKAFVCKIGQISNVQKHQAEKILQLFSATRQATMISLGSFLLLVLTAFSISIWLAYTIARHLTRQTHELIAAMKAFSGGDLERHVEVESHDEIGEIGKEFNKLAASIRQNTTRIQEMAVQEQKMAAALTEKVARYRACVEKIAQGDLTQAVETEGNDDLSQLGGNLNNMTTGLARMASEIKEASNTMNATLAELQGAINSQSSGASEQAAAVNQTTSTLEEIKATSNQTLEKAKMLGEMSERTRREGEQGSSAVQEAISGMEAVRARVEGIAQTILALSEQTQQIGEITGVVTNLAQQSKMLALNASIEAAKAGEAGKGFAVVAAEVKELAEQSQQSTAQVQKILQDIRHATDRAVMATEEGSKGVDSGVLLVQRSGDVMHQLNEVIRETSLASQQIVAAVRQEAVGIEQVAIAMSEINKVTSQFVTGTQQSKQVASDLGVVAERLRDSVGVYRI